MCRLLLLIGLICSALLIGGPAQLGAQEKYALLVGVSRYPALGERYQLSGPPNDVELMRRMLVERFGFSPDGDSIRILTESAGEKDPALLPTRENITREFSKLAKDAHEQDDVVVFMAGHGAQQPQSELDKHLEPDGLDQVFLPRDVEKWAGDADGGAIPNAITDNEIGEWLRKIRENDARIWVIFDCCHSGDITRGIGETERFVPEGSDGLAIPGDVIAKSKQLSADRREESKILRGTLDIDRQEGMAILYACQRTEKAIERTLPTSATGHPHGLLTYCLSSVLAQAKGSMSYQELGRRIQLEYISLGRTNGPTPLMEGADISRAVLGSESIDRPLNSITRDERTGKLWVDLGHLHGVTTNSILAVYPPPGKSMDADSEKPIGYLRVDVVEIASAMVSPCSYADSVPLRAEAYVGGRCEIEELNYGELKIAVAVDTLDSDSQPIPIEIWKTLDGALEQIAQEQNSLVNRVATPADAAWVIRWTRDVLLLVPASSYHTRLQGASHSETRVGHDLRLFEFDNADFHDQGKEDLRNALIRVSRAMNLLQLTTDTNTTPSHLGVQAVDLKIDILRSGKGVGRNRELQPTPVRVDPGDMIEFQVRNDGNLSFDLTLLYVDSQYGITALFPAVGENNRFQPGDIRPIPGIEINDQTSGREHLIAIAVSTKGRQPISFATLEQPSLEHFRSANQERATLQELLETGLYGTGAARSAGRKDASSFRMETVPFDVSISK